MVINQEENREYLEEQNVVPYHSFAVEVVNNASEI
jgi:hypothetical protein